MPPGKGGCRMRSDDKVSIFIDVLGIAMMITAVILGTTVLPLAACRAKAKGMGVPCTWGPLQGCMITTPRGQVIPIDQYRVIE